MKKRYEGVKKKTMVCLPVFLVVMLLLGGTLFVFAENSDGTTSFSQNYVTQRQAVDYQVDKVIVERVKVGQETVEPENVEPDLPRGIEFIFYGYEAKEVINVIDGKVVLDKDGKVTYRSIADLNSKPDRVYPSVDATYIIDGVSRVGINWDFVQERYNRWQVNGYDRNPVTGFYDIPNGKKNGMKPEFFQTPSTKWNVYNDITPSTENFVAERGYNDFVYRPAPFTRTDGTIIPEVTFYMDYAINNEMEFVKKTHVSGGSDNKDYLVATFHVYPIHLTEYDPPPPSEGGVQGEDEE